MYARPYSVAHNHRELFRQELDRLVGEGVLEPCGATEWASPTFITPKKDGRVRWVSDFRELNKVIRRRVYPLPRIQDILAKRTGYAFFTKLDISMQFYTFELDEESRDLCAIVTPFGKYRYCRLPMGVKVSPDVAQEIMEDVLQNIPDNDVFMDDCGVFSKTWESHLATLDTILTRLQDNGFTINPLKCEWAVQETDWLGHWLTPTGLKPWRKKIEPLLRLAPPKSVTQVRQFVGAVTFYRDFFRRRSHVLAPLTALIGTKKFDWTPECDRAFNEMKALLSEDALLRYPDPNLPFHIYTDASDLQLGSVIHQNDAPVAYFSRKLSDAQTRYSTIEKELLSVYETLRTFRPILLGAELHVHTDHRNLTFKHLNSHRVLYWRLLIEEFAPTFHYIPGKDNTCADALSRLPSLPPIASEEEQGPGDTNSLFADPLLLNCFVNLPADEPEQLFPLAYDLLQQRQQQDQRVQALLNDPVRYELLPFADNVQLVCRKGEQLHDPFRIVIPDALLQPIVRWYHERLGHAGSTRLFETISALFYHGERLKDTVETTVRRCPICQDAKLPPRGVGELATREAILAPWEEVHVDCIGPWTLDFQGREVTIDALTCIDPVSNLVELLRVDNKTAAHVAMKFENNWLARYPRPVRCIHDNGPEFIGFAFKQMLHVNGIADKPVSKLNPQSNAICERMHRTVADHIRTLFRAQPPNNANAVNDIVDTALAATGYALRASVNRALRTSPSVIAFHRDMILNIPFLADLALIRNRRQVLIDEQLRRANLKRHSFDYQPGQQVFLRIKNPTKLGPRSTGPYAVTQVHTNGTITIQRRQHVTERINIRRVYPFRP